MRVVLIESLVVSKRKLPSIDKAKWDVLIRILTKYAMEPKGRNAIG